MSVRAIFRAHPRTPFAPTQGAALRAIDCFGCFAVPATLAVYPDMKWYMACLELAIFKASQDKKTMLFGVFLVARRIRQCGEWGRTHGHFR